MAATLPWQASVENRYHLGIVAAIMGTTAHTKRSYPIQMASHELSKTAMHSSSSARIAVRQTKSDFEEQIAVILPSAFGFQDTAIEDYAEAGCDYAGTNGLGKHLHSGTVAGNGYTRSDVSDTA